MKYDYDKNAEKLGNAYDRLNRRLGQGFAALTDEHQGLFLDGVYDFNGKRIISMSDPRYTLQWTLRMSPGTSSRHYEGSPEAGYVSVVISDEPEIPMDEPIMPLYLDFGKS